jgi:hypothetical protein
MYQVTISGGDRPTRRYDLHELPIGGTMAHLLGPGELYRSMLAVGVPDISPHLGWYPLALRYAEFLAAAVPTSVMKSRRLIASPKLWKQHRTRCRHQWLKRAATSWQRSIASDGAKPEVQFRRKSFISRQLGLWPAVD